MVKILVMSAREAVSAVYGSANSYTPFGDQNNFAVVSITDEMDVSKMRIVFQEAGNLQKVLRLPFMDIPPSQADLDPSKSMVEQFGLDNELFAWKHVGILMSFADMCITNNWNILVHCEAGVSRSQAIGAFFEVYINHDASNLLSRLHDWNTEYFTICWQALASHFADKDKKKAKKAKLLAEFTPPIRQKEKVSDEDFFSFEDIGSCMMDEQEQHKLTPEQHGPLYPEVFMLGLKNIPIIQELGLADNWHMRGRVSNSW